MSTIRVGRQNTSYRVHDLLSPDVDLLNLHSYFLSHLGPRYVRTRTLNLPMSSKATSSLLPDFSPPYQSINLLLFLQKQNLATAIYLFGLCTLLISSKVCTSGGHFLFPPLPVFSLSYCPYSDQYFLFWVLYSSLSG